MGLELSMNWSNSAIEQLKGNISSMTIGFPMSPGVQSRFFLSSLRTGSFIRS
jgi:hypothetical protein